jgi:hypothetical protein
MGSLPPGAGRSAPPRPGARPGGEGDGARASGGGALHHCGAEHLPAASLSPRVAISCRAVVSSRSDASSRRPRHVPRHVSFHHRGPLQGAAVVECAPAGGARETREYGS